jgi:hypothetical protein
MVLSPTGVELHGQTHGQAKRPRRLTGGVICGLTWGSVGADDGIRTRDPNLGKVEDPSGFYGNSPEFDVIEGHSGEL